MDPKQREVSILQTGPRSLVASFVGAPPGPPPCGSDPSLDVIETADEVGFTIDDPVARRGAAEGGVCSTVGHTWNLQIELDAPLADRPVLGPDGQPRPVARAAVLANVPSGYALSSIEPGTPTRTTYGGPGGTMLIVQRDSGLLADPFVAYDLTATFEVAGRTGKLYSLGPDQLVVTWTADEVRMSIHAIGVGGRAGDVLVRLAQEHASAASADRSRD